MGSHALTHDLASAARGAGWRGRAGYWAGGCDTSSFEIAFGVAEMRSFERVLSYDSISLFSFSAAGSETRRIDGRWLESNTSDCDRKP